MTAIQQAVQTIKNQIAQAAVSAGRSAGEITLLAATKTRTAAEVREVLAAGADAVGENRAQELAAKWDTGAYSGALLHFIGVLQSNKAKMLVGRVDMIQSVDSLRLCQTIGRLAAKQGITQNILLEVNIGGEAEKSGFAPDAILAACESAANIEGISLRGLMAIPPAQGDPTPYFAAMRALFDRAAQNQDKQFSALSMGMSGDFAKAIAEGSTLVRVGTALFGPRPVRGEEK